MLQLTKRTEYALIAMTHLARRQGACISVRELCEQYPIPRRFVAEVLKELCRANLVESQRGANGGYSLTRPAASIDLGQVVEALEGEPSITSCGPDTPTTNGECDVELSCPIKNPILRVRRQIIELLEQTTLADLISPVHTNLAPLSEPTR
jgi:Rrf2 family protein